MKTDAGLTIVVFADTILGPNGVRSFYRTLLDWSKRTKSVRVVMLCPAGDLDEAERLDEDVITVCPEARLPNPFYRDLVLGYYSQTKLREIVQSISGRKIIHIATSGPLGVGGARLARRLRLPWAVTT